jgi:hypothetical protein
MCRVIFVASTSLKYLGMFSRQISLSSVEMLLQLFHGINGLAMIEVGRTISIGDRYLSAIVRENDVIESVSKLHDTILFWQQNENSTVKVRI